MKKDTRSFIQKMLLMVILILALMFRRISGVVLPIITVTLTIVSAVSLMALFNSPFTVVTQIMPSFLLAVITGASIHLLAIFYKDFAKTGDKKSALRFAMGHSGFAKIKITMSSIFWIKLRVSFFIACLITPENNADPARYTLKLASSYFF
jgi:predicted RND superfamily exporter protein